MVMTARERIIALISDEEPDKIPVFAYDWLRVGSQGGWVRRLVNRGLGIIRFVPAYKPAYEHPYSINPFLPDVKYIKVHYTEKNVVKYRHTFETPVGSITGVIRINPFSLEVALGSQEEYFVKQPSDWRVVNYIFKGVRDKMTTNYEAFKREEDELGDTGLTFAFVEKTPYQKAWVELASPERAFIDFHEQPEELCEYIEIQRQIHTQIAEITAESPAKLVNIDDNITDMITPYYFREYCTRFYDIYSKVLEGTGKILASHLDGRLGHLKKEIAEAPLKVVESFTVPPTGEISLTEARLLWPDKLLFINTPPHLALAEPKEVREGYQAIGEEWGSKKGLLIEHSEEMPLEKVESHLSAAMDVFGY
jgi:hypothetical protein